MSGSPAKNRKTIKPTNNIHIRWMVCWITHRKKLLEKSSPQPFEWVDCEWADLWWHDEQKEANEWVWDAHKKVSNWSGNNAHNGNNVSKTNNRSFFSVQFGCDFWTTFVTGARDRERESQQKRRRPDTNIHKEKEWEKMREKTNVCSNMLSIARQNHSKTLWQVALWLTIKTATTMNGKIVWSYNQFWIWRGCNAFRQAETNLLSFLFESVNRLHDDGELCYSFPLLSLSFVFHSLKYPITSRRNTIWICQHLLSFSVFSLYFHSLSRPFSLSWHLPSFLPVGVHNFYISQIAQMTNYCFLIVPIIHFSRTVPQSHARQNRLHILKKPNS